MNKFKFIKTSIKDLYILEPKIHKDQRGDFYKFFSKDEFRKIFFNGKILQANLCTNKYSGTLRGFHYQKKPYSETKIITCTSGEIFDVAIDIRKQSKTYLKYFGVKLSDKNKKALLIPRGFAHGYITLKRNTTIVYLVDNIYNPKFERGIIYNDPFINVKWPIKPRIVSPKDKKLKNYNEKD